MNNPELSIGILNDTSVHFILNGPFLVNGSIAKGVQHTTVKGNKIQWNNNDFEELLFAPAEPANTFSVCKVTIGIDFHWERQETQAFSGKLKLVPTGNSITAINILPIEEYLKSVISSEMNAASSLEFLKAHAVISRSWALSQIENNRGNSSTGEKKHKKSENEDEYIRWYDKENHTLFDVCADDHCQRYQGITRISNPAAVKAVEMTFGEVLMHDDKICDARFSKCCGGVSEEFRFCWEDRNVPYLTAIRDTADECAIPDLTDETNAERWIRAEPDSFCHTNDRRLLSQILNGYDSETNDFYRWKVHYTQEELRNIIYKKTQTDYGQIKALIPVERGRSGRICRLKIVGTRKSLTIGKELEIRRTISESHLLSSAFVIDTDNEKSGIPSSFTLTGAGWGHGVGLCQIGAAVMGEKGYDYRTILHHYYKNLYNF